VEAQCWKAYLPPVLDIHHLVLPFVYSKANSIYSRIVNLGVGVLMILGGIGQFFPIELYVTSSHATRNYPALCIYPFAANKKHRQRLFFIST
jgi:hypothetical protein